MQAQLAPGQRFEQLVQGAGAAGQHHHRIGVHDHHFFAFVHGFGDDECAQVGLADLAPQQVYRDHAKGLAACGLSGARHLSHQAHIASAIDQPPTRLGQQRAHPAGRLGIGGHCSGARSAIDTNGFDGHGRPFRDSVNREMGL